MSRFKITALGFIVVLSLAIFSAQGSGFMPPMGDMDCQSQVDCCACSAPVLPNTVKTDAPTYAFQTLEGSLNYLPLKQAGSLYHPPR